ncbi:hypothetical protein D3C72_850130 [compost metagenome]
MKVQNANRYTAKNSGELKDMANSAIRVDTKVSSNTPHSAPIRAELNAAVSASAARPSRAIGYPSKVVATDEGSPGMLNSIEVIEPPNSAPQYMHDNRMIADTGDMVKVSGSNSATPLGAPRPGNTPTRMPSSTPITIRPIWPGVRIRFMPCSRESNSLI